MGKLMEATNEIAKRLKQLAEEHPEQVEKLMTAIMQDENNMQKLEGMSNREISDLLLKEVWVDIDMWTWKSAIVETAIERLRDLS